MNVPKPQPRSKMPSAPPNDNSPEDVSNLPNVPMDLPDVPTGDDKSDNDEIDFDDLSRRFNELKKKK